MARESLCATGWLSISISANLRFLLDTQHCTTAAEKRHGRLGMLGINRTISFRRHSKIVASLTGRRCPNGRMVHGRASLVKDIPERRLSNGAFRSLICHVYAFGTCTVPAAGRSSSLLAIGAPQFVCITVDHYTRSSTLTPSWAPFPCRLHWTSTTTTTHTAGHERHIQSWTGEPSLGYEAVRVYLILNCLTTVCLQGSQPWTLKGIFWTLFPLLQK